MNYPIITLNDIAYCEVGLDYAVSPHTHTFFQWYCVIYGTVDTVVDKVTHTLKAEEGILIPPGVERAPRCRDKAPGYLRVHFDNHGLQLHALYQRPLTISGELRPDLHMLVSELQQPGLNTEALVETLVIRLLIGLERHALSNSLPSSSPLNTESRQELIGRLEIFMQRNLHRTLTHATMAQAVNLSATHLARLYVQSTGKTLTERLIELRIDTAKKLLLESTLSITTICEQVGYNSLSHFTRTFKSQVGISPSDYRRTGGLTWRGPQ